MTFFFLIPFMTLHCEQKKRTLAMYTLKRSTSDTIDKRKKRGFWETLQSTLRISPLSSLLPAFISLFFSFISKGEKLIYEILERELEEGNKSVAKREQHKRELSRGVQ